MLMYTFIAGLYPLLSAGCCLAIAVYVAYLVDTVLAFAHSLLTLEHPSIWQCLVQGLIVLVSCTATVCLSLYFAQNVKTRLGSSPGSSQPMDHPHCACGVLRDNGKLKPSPPENQERPILSTDPGKLGGRSSFPPSNSDGALGERAAQGSNELNGDTASAAMPIGKFKWKVAISASARENDEEKDKRDEHEGGIEEGDIHAIRAAVRRGDKDAVESYEMKYGISKLGRPIRQDLLMNALQSNTPDLVNLLTRALLNARDEWSLALILQDVEELMGLVLDSNLVKPEEIFGYGHLLAAACSHNTSLFHLFLEALMPDPREEIRLLHDAAEHHANNAVGFLLSRGKITARDFVEPVDFNTYISCTWAEANSYNPLAGAAVSGNAESIQLLIDHGFDITMGYSKLWPPLYLAAQHGRLSALKLLLDLGAGRSPNSPSKLTLLHIALESGHGEVADYLIECGISLKPNEISLRTAVLGGSVKLARLILEQNEDSILERCHLYGSLLQASAARGDKKMAQFLIEHGADVNEFVDHLLLGGNGPFMAAVSSCATDAWIGLLVELLIDNGADMNRAHSCFGNALQTAVVLGHTEVVRILLEHGFEADGKVDKYGSVLWIAANRTPSGWQEEITDVLRKHGAEAWVPASNQTW